MTRDLRREAEAIFHEIADLPSERQAERIEARCGSWHALRSAVERLLRATDDVMGDFMRTGAAAPSANAGVLPDRIGGYRIERQLGAGGMGLVYAAHQEHPARRVAVKVLRPELVTPALLRRFRHEVDVLASLEHAGIAHLYEAGTAEITVAGARCTQPYFAMELVDGEPLTAYADRHRLDPRQRLELIATVCDAVQHAHQQGIIHRDLKPANILVDQAGRPKVLDFGVARVTSEDVASLTRHTAAGQLVGTLAYMSPEQLTGDAARLDTRSDVYALGVIAFELLTGRLPYDVAGRPLAAAARLIADAAPPPLGACNRAYRGDVETIVAKALAKEPADRYASVHALADDLRRFLRHEPITARPPSALYHLRKLAQRNRPLVGGLAAALACLVLGLALATYGLITASRERDEKAAALRTEAAARAEAEAIAAFLGDMLSAVDPRRDGRDARVIDLLDAAAAHVGVQFAEQPLLQARLRHVIGTTYQQLGVFAPAEPHLRYALDTRTRLLGPTAPDTIDALHELGALYREWGRYAEAEPLSLQALALNRQLRGDRSEPTIAALHALGSLYSKQGRHEEALPLQEEAHDLCRALLGHDHPVTLSAANNLGLLYRRLGRFDAARALYEETLATRQRTLGDEHPDTLVSLNNLAHLYRALGRYQESADLHARTLATRRRVLTEQHPHTAMSMDNLAMLLSDLERFDEAEALYVEALEHKRSIYGADGPETLVTQNNLARNYTRQGRLDEAVRLHEENLAARRRVLGNDHPNTLVSLSDLGVAYRAQGRLAEAEQLHREALDGHRRALGDEHPDTLRALNNLALLIWEQGRLADAEPLLEASLAGSRRVLGDDHPDTLSVLNNLGVLLRELGRPADAEGPGAEAARRAVRVLPTASWEAGVYLYQHARTLAALERHADAEAGYLAAYEVLVAAMGERHARARRCAQALAELYDAWHAVAPGRGFDAKAAEWRAQAAPAPP